MSHLPPLPQPVSTGLSPHRPVLPPADGALHIGSVPYLNVRPLLRALRHAYAEPGPWTELYPAGIKITEAVPRVLAEQDRRGEFHASIVPVFEVLSQGRGGILPGTCIAARGPVESVVLFANEPLESLTRIELDPASLTSIHLVQVLLSRRGQEVEYLDAPVDPSPTPAPLRLAPRTGRLLIGDAALARRGFHATEWDLASAWISATGLPFVFAAWHTPETCWAAPHHPLAQLFQRVAQVVDHHRLVAAREDGPLFGFQAPHAEAYLTRAIHYGFGVEEQAGLDHFANECRRLGFLPRSIPAQVEWASPVAVP